MELRLKSIDEILSSPYLLVGFTSIDQAAKYISNSPHSILLNGCLLYAYLGEGSVKSVVITSHRKRGKIMVSVMYDGYKMIHCGRKIEHLESLIYEFESDKRLKLLHDSLKSRFYE